MQDSMKYEMRRWMACSALLVWTGIAGAAEITVGDSSLAIGPLALEATQGEVFNLDVYGLISSTVDAPTSEYLIKVELSPQASASGTLRFTSAIDAGEADIEDLAPTDVFDPSGFTFEDTAFGDSAGGATGTGSALQNAARKTNTGGALIALDYDGPLVRFPIIAGATASGTWDVLLTFNASATSEWLPLTAITTIRVEGTITVVSLFCNSGADCLDGTCSGGSNDTLLCGNDTACPGGTCVDNPCTDNVCTGGVCSHPNNTAACDDGDLCTTSDVCSGGTCSGSAVVCAVPDQCHLSATCIAANAVCTGGTNDGTACTDDSACFGGGACVGVCDNPNAVDGAGCDDGQACNVGETCQGGLCTSGAAQDCTTAGNQCNTASCDITGVEGNCDTLTPVADNTACSDGDPCTLPDVCSNGICTTSSPVCPGTAPDCQSLVCDPIVNGVCVGGTSGGVLCTDDTACASGGGVCTVGACSATATTRCLSDGDCPGSETCNLACTAQAVADGTACDDSAPCTGNDQCTGGACAGASLAGCLTCSVPADCDAANPNAVCRISECNAGVCAYPLNPPSLRCPTLTLESVPGSPTCLDPALTCTGGDNAGLPCTDIFDCPGGTCDPGALDPGTNQVIVNVVMTGMGNAAGMNTCIGGTTPGASCNLDSNCVASSACDTVNNVCTSGVDAGQFCTLNSQCHVRCNKVVSGQFYLEYDQAKLEFQSVAPTTAFPANLFFSHDPVGGTIDYLGGVALGAAGTSADNTIMAAITFKAIAACVSDAAVTFRTHAPTSGVADTAGFTVAGVITDDMVPVRIDGLAPDFGITCPADRTVSADVGGTTAAVSWTQPTAIDACDGARAVSCVAQAGSCVIGGTACVIPGDCPSGGACIALASQPIAVNGGTFPEGTTQVTCTATDACGNGGPCVFNVTVVANNVLFVDVELAGADGDMVRCITFELSNCADLGQTSVTVEAQMAFVKTDPLVNSSRVTGFPLAVPTGVYTCVTARDRLHTLLGKANVTSNGVTHSASFDTASFGIALRGGDFNDDKFVDIVDFAILNSQFNTQVAANTGCLGLPEFPPVPAQWNADLSGNGIVGIEDFSFLAVNFTKGDAAGCCAITAGFDGDGSPGPIMQISVAELEARGLHELTGADRNGDGWVDMQDVAAFAAGDVPVGDDPVAPPVKSLRHGRRKR